MLIEFLIFENYYVFLILFASAPKKQRRWQFVQRERSPNKGPDSSGKMRAGRGRGQVLPLLDRYLTTEHLLNLPRVTWARPRQASWRVPRTPAPVRKTLLRRPGILNSVLGDNGQEHLGARSKHGREIIYCGRTGLSARRRKVTFQSSPRTTSPAPARATG